MQELKREIENANEVDLESLSFYDPVKPNLYPEQVVKLSLGDDGTPVAFLVRMVVTADVLLELPPEVSHEIQKEGTKREKGDPITEEELERGRLLLQFHRQAVTMGLVKPELDDVQIAQLPNDIVIELSDVITMVNDDG